MKKLKLKEVSQKVLHLVSKLRLTLSVLEDLGDSLGLHIDWFHHNLLLLIT